ncbi:MAG: NAD-dependent epimerase/dehydratase family protein [Pseudomonadota bacterium]
MIVLPRIMVTGLGGFVGRHVSASLARRAELLAANVDGRRADLLIAADRASLFSDGAPEILLHLAWETEHGKFWASPANSGWEDASADLFSRFYDAGGQRVIGIGTCAEYDWTTGEERFVEDAPLAPHTAYGAAKVRTAETLRRIAEGAGGTFAWGRVFFSFGAGEPPARLIPAILRAVRSGDPLGIGPSTTVRDFWHVRHLGDAIAALCLSEVTGPVNLSSGLGVTFGALAGIANRLGRADLIRPDARALGPGEPRLLVGDTTVLRESVGYTPPDLLAEDLAAYAETFPRA